MHVAGYFGVIYNPLQDRDKRSAKEIIQSHLLPADENCICEKYSGDQNALVPPALGATNIIQQLYNHYNKIL